MKNERPTLKDLEASIEKLYQHQEESLRLRKQGVEDQMEFSKLWSQLMERKLSLFQRNIEIPDSLENSLNQLMDHHRQTVQMNEQYLRTQREENQIALRMLEQQFHHVSTEPVQQTFQQPVTTPPTQRPLPTGQVTVPRAVAQLRALQPVQVNSSATSPQSITLIIDNGTPLTETLANRMMNAGWNVVILSFPTTLIPASNQISSNIQRVILPDLTEESLKQSLGQIMAGGPIGNLIHLHTGNPQVADGSYQFSSVGEKVLQHVFLLAKHLKLLLIKTAELERSRFFTITFMDGMFGQSGNYACPIDGGFFGLTKTLKREAPSVFCRALDVSPTLNIQDMAERIFAELNDQEQTSTEPGQSLIEIGLLPEARVTIIAEPRDTQTTVDNAGIDRNSLFLVSGGAKGVTAKCVIELARHYQCRFILLGRSSVEGELPEWVKSCANDQELQQQLMREIQAKGEKPSLGVIRSRIGEIKSKLEVEETLTAIRQAGGDAVYLSADITNPDKLKAALAPVSEQFGSITGLIHGAGVLADKYLEKKTIEDFQRVFTTKVRGLEALMSVVNPAMLKHLVLFSSTAGFYGNEGQADYAVANEILNRFACLFKNRSPESQVIAFNWGPWDGGMVTPELKKKFAEKNIFVIPVQGGAETLVDELARGERPAPQIVVGSSM